MKIINICFLLSVSLVSLYTSGCAGEPFPLYSGPKLPKNEIATVLVCVGSAIKDIEIDGINIEDEIKKQYPNGPRYCHVSILPGKHEIKWLMKFSALNFPFKGQGTLDAKAGASYRFIGGYQKGEHVRTAFDETGRLKHYYKVDSTSTSMTRYYPNTSSEDWTSHSP